MLVKPSCNALLFCSLSSIFACILSLGAGSQAQVCAWLSPDIELYLVARSRFGTEGGIELYLPKIPVKFYYVYVLYNQPKNFIYIGYSEDLRTRVISHNNGENKSTKAYIPLELIHYEAYKNKKDAKRRELYLKTNRGRTTLMTRLTEYFEDNAKPKNARTCPICGGSGKAANDVAFYRGNRYSKNVTICLTCSGRGWIDSTKIIKQIE